MRVCMYVCLCVCALHGGNPRLRAPAVALFAAVCCPCVSMVFFHPSSHALSSVAGSRLPHTYNQAYTHTHTQRNTHLRTLARGLCASVYALTCVGSHSVHTVHGKTDLCSCSRLEASCPHQRRLLHRLPTLPSCTVRIINHINSLYHCIIL